MRSGKWEVGSGKLEVGSEKWEVRSEKWEVGSGNWEVGSGKWEVGSEKWLDSAMSPGWGEAGIAKRREMVQAAMFAAPNV